MSFWKSLTPKEQASCFVATSRPVWEFTFKGIKRLKAWPVVGPLAEDWNGVVLPKIIEVSNQQNFKQKIFGNDQRYRVSALPKWSLYLVGSKAQVGKVKPWVVAGHRDIDVAKRASRAMEDLSDGSLAPILQGYEFYHVLDTIVPVADDNNGSRSNTSDQHINLCGLHVIALHSDPASSTPSTSWIHSTIGGCVKIKGEHYGITAAHAFQRAAAEGSPSSQQEGEQSDEALNADRDFGSLEHRKVYAHNAVSDDVQNGSSSLSDQHLPRGMLLNGINSDDSESSSVASIIYSSSKDWALVPITNKLFDTDNRIDLGNGRYVSIGRVTAVSPQKPVFVASGVTPPAFTMLSGTASAILLPGSDQLQMVWTILRASEPGDCGSWVIDEDGHPLGMVVAASTPSPGRSSETYCLPLTSIFQDIAGLLNDNKPFDMGDRTIPLVRTTEAPLSTHPSYDTMVAEQDDAENASTGSSGNTDSDSDSDLEESGVFGEDGTNPRFSQTSLSRKRQRVDWDHDHELQTRTSRSKLISSSEHSPHHNNEQDVSGGRNATIKPLRRQATVESDEDERLPGTDTEHDDDDVNRGDNSKAKDITDLHFNHESNTSESETVIPRHDGTQSNTSNHLDKENDTNDRTSASKLQPVDRQAIRDTDTDTVSPTPLDSGLAQNPDAQALTLRRDSEDSSVRSIEVHDDRVEEAQTPRVERANLQDENTVVIREDDTARETYIEAAAPQPAHTKPPVTDTIASRGREREDSDFVPSRRARSPSPEHGRYTTVTRYIVRDLSDSRSRSRERSPETRTERVKTVHARALSRERAHIITDKKISPNDADHKIRDADSDSEEEVIIRREERVSRPDDHHGHRVRSPSSLNVTRPNDDQIVITRKNDFDRRMEPWTEYEEREEVTIRRFIRHEPEKDSPRREHEQSREREEIVLRERRQSPPSPPSPHNERGVSKEREEIIIRREEPTAKAHLRDNSRGSKEFVYRRPTPPPPPPPSMRPRERSEERIIIRRRDRARSPRRPDTSFERDIAIESMDRHQPVRRRSTDREEIIIRRDERSRSLSRPRRRWSRDRYDDREKIIIRRQESETRIRRPLRDTEFDKEEIIIRRDRDDATVPDFFRDDPMSNNALILSERVKPRRADRRLDNNKLYQQNQERMNDIVLGVMEESNRLASRRTGKLDDRVFSRNYIDPEILDKHRISWRYTDTTEKLIRLMYSLDESRETMLRASTKELQQRRLDATHTAETNYLWNIDRDREQDKPSSAVHSTEPRPQMSGPINDNAGGRTTVDTVRTESNAADAREQQTVKALECQLDLHWENFVQDELWKAGCSTEFCDEILKQHAEKEKRKEEFLLESERRERDRKSITISEAERRPREARLQGTYASPTGPSGQRVDSAYAYR